jgi:hypothetical protein
MNSQNPTGSDVFSWHKRVPVTNPFLESFLGKQEDFFLLRSPADTPTGLLWHGWALHESVHVPFEGCSELPPSHLTELDSIPTGDSRFVGLALANGLGEFVSRLQVPGVSCRSTALESFHCNQ